MTYVRKAVRGSGMFFSMTSLALVIGYITRIVLARNLTPTEYGLFYSVFTFVAFFLFFRDLGLPQAQVKYMAEFNAGQRYGEIKSVLVSVVGLELIASTLMGTVFFLIAPYLAGHYFKSPDAVVMLRLLILYVFGSVFFAVAHDALQGFQHFFLASLGEVLKNTGVLLLTLLFIYFGYKSVAPVLALVAVSYLLFIFYGFFLLKCFPFFQYQTENLKEITKKVFYFGIPMFATAAGGKVVAYIDTLILTYFRPLSEVGIYNVVLPSALILATFGSSIGGTLFPITAELWAKNDRLKLITGFNLLHRYVFLAMIPLAMTLFIFARFILQLLFGAEYASGAMAYQILVVGSMFYAMGFANNLMISALGQPKVVMKIILLAAVSNTVLNLLFIPKYGIVAAAASTTFSYLLVLVLSTHKVAKYIGTHFPLWVWIRLSFCSVAFWLLTFEIQHWLVLNIWLKIIISFALSFLVYFLLILKLKIVEWTEIKRLARLVLKHE